MKKSKLGYILAYSAIFCGAAVIAGRGIEALIADSPDPANEEWGHYDAVAATFENPGCREFWISCDTHSVVLEEPSTGIIVDRGAPNVATIETWSNKSDGRYVPEVTEFEYGKYPQSVVPAANTSLISALDAVRDGDTTDEARYFYDGNEYVYKEVVPDMYTYYFSDSTMPTSGTTRYFKVEPIKWRVVNYDETQKNVCLLSDVILNCTRFDATINIYEESGIRDWLNNSFYNEAFDEMNVLKEHSTLNDKVFLLSADDYKSGGFDNHEGSSPGRVAKPTDYAKANGAYAFNSDANYYGNGVYWTSSPGVESDGAMCVAYDGAILQAGVYACYVGARPAIILDMNVYEGTSLSYDLDQSLALFGSYPQSVVPADRTELLNDISNAPLVNGYRVWNAKRYKYVEANPYTGSTFDNGTAISSGTGYYFEVEPIRWRVLSVDGDNLSLVTDRIVDVQKYDSRSDSGTISTEARNNYNGTDKTTSTADVYANNYKYSGIRKWLNEDFIENMGLSADVILTTTVNNAAATTDDSNNAYECANTEDKVYLLSYQDYINASYFSNDAARYAKPTDYAKANYACIDVSSSYNGNGRYWTRSPASGGSSSASSLAYNGYIYGNGVSTSYNGVCPALRVSVN